MRLFQALATLWKGFVSIFISDIAKANPEAAYEGIIQNRLEEGQKLVKAAGELRGQLNIRRAELAKAEREFKETEAALTVAVRQNKGQVGSVLIRKKEALAKQLTDLRPRVAQLEEADKRIKAQTAEFNRKIVELREKAKINVARLRSAQAQKRIMDMIDGLSIRGDDQMERAIDESVEATIGEVEVRSEVAGGNLDAELAQVQQEAAQSIGEDEFAALRAQYEASQGATAATTGDGAGADGEKKL